ncbi:50S ribosomal protein L9 [Maritalea porphyrae]|jgi:large subunit ribosomal protein L9|uniref:50S ribosomal protein L9 n=1 Tax=Maritalea porphyrae TaxID=880732 RepID=UPI0022AE85FE|nr:50S ribosomal protein L9 [Maritalea porphyrae]MCZ4270972.1 50S ribosomal protein L9 [Maritalea porphyrae]
MKVILLERVGRLGTIGDEVSVKDGFARNFLLPQGKALRANNANRARFESERDQIEQRNAERRDNAMAVAEAVNGRKITMIRQAGETGVLYGSVSSRDISDALIAENIQVAKSQVDLSLPIKNVGLHNVVLNLHAEVDSSITVNVARSADEAERQAAGEDMTVVSYEDDAPVAEVVEEEADAEAGEEAAAEADEATEEEATA